MIRNRKLHLVLLLSIMLFIVGVKSPSVCAEGSDYGVVPVLPSSQKDDTKSFYDFVFKDEEPAELKFTIGNTSKEDKRFSVLVFNAATNTEGIIDYSSEKLKENVTKDKQLTKYLKPPKSFVVPSHQVKEISMKFDPPKADFEGYILGAIQIVPELGNEDNKAGFSNLFTRTIAVRAWSKKNKIAETKINNLPSKFIANNKNRASVNYHLENKGSQIEKDISIKTTLKRGGKNNSNLLKEAKRKVDFAPSSYLNIKQKFDKKLSDGKYMFLVETFKDEKKQSEYLYKFRVNKGRVANNNGIIIFSIVVVVILSVVSYIYIKRRKKIEK